MTEQEWLACEDPARMLDFLQHWTQDDATDPNRPNPHPPSDRKLWLYDVARLRSVTGDGDGEALAVATRLAQRADSIDPGGDGMWDAGFMLRWLREAVYLRAILESDSMLKREWTILLRCLFGNPFRLVVWRGCPRCDWLGKLDNERLPRGWQYCPHCKRPDGLNVATRTPTVVNVAQAIYDTRRFEDMPVLADALEEAGCTEASILDHCRAHGPHARGCWVLDLLLGKA